MKTLFNRCITILKTPLGVSAIKFIPVLIMLLFSTYSYSQHSRAYYPNAHDTGGDFRPELIKKNFLYYGFLSSVNQHISIEYNREMTDEVMIVASIGIINSGLSQQQETYTTNSVGGAYGEFGVKLFLNPDYRESGRHNYFAEEGLYIKPQIVVSVFNTEEPYYLYSPYAYPPSTTTNQYTYTGVALLVSFGMQWEIAHTLMFDLYAGAGVCFSGSSSSSAPTTDNYFSYLSTGESNVPLAFTAGVNIGLPFK